MRYYLSPRKKYSQYQNNILPFTIPRWFWFACLALGLLVVLVLR
ncbi:MAG TPA: hypothetical protein VFV38_49410 [Ktedonobacteraceae bacterium]|nr:hypothetical protein [Ktedonobacteraceae bacterium]